MSWVLIAFQILAKLPTLLVVAEQAFDDVPDSGAQKKEMVLTTARAIVEGMLGISTGGQAELWTRVERIISPAVDIMCSFIFPEKKRGAV